jgi:multidrug efflux pump subunit AcrA (membrane-fusion protein)
MKVLLSPSLSLCLLVFVAGCSTSNSQNTQHAQAASAPSPIAIDAAKVETRELQRSVEAVGTLDPNEEVIVSNQVEGIVDKLFVDLGDAVRAGQVIAQLDTRELELNVHQQEATLQQELARVGLTDANASFDEAGTSQVRQAEATLADAKIRLDRTKKLAESGVIAQQQLDAQQAQYDFAESPFVRRGKRCGIFEPRLQRARPLCPSRKKNCQTRRLLLLWPVLSRIVQPMWVSF